MSPWVFLGAAALLGIERICYLWIWHAPARFRLLCTRPLLAWIGEPVDVLCALFCAFKILQCAVFFAWCYIYGYGSLLADNGSMWWLGLGATMLVAGQYLNFGVFHRLGKVGVFYGNKLGYKIPWSRKFPFSCLKHPQYVGALLSIWGFFWSCVFRTTTGTGCRLSKPRTTPSARTLNAEFQLLRRGKVNRLKDGYGFVTDAIDNKSRFFHHSSLQGELFNNLCVGDEVEFEPDEDGKNGKAINIKLITSSVRHSYEDNRRQNQ